jgi:hypothetical protein
MRAFTRQRRPPVALQLRAPGSSTVVELRDEEMRRQHGTDEATETGDVTARPYHSTFPVYILSHFLCPLPSLFSIVFPLPTRTAVSFGFFSPFPSGEPLFEPSSCVPRRSIHYTSFPKRPVVQLSSLNTGYRCNDRDDHGWAVSGRMLCQTDSTHSHSSHVFHVPQHDSYRLAGHIHGTAADQQRRTTGRHSPAMCLTALRRWWR